MHRRESASDRASEGLGGGECRDPVTSANAGTLSDDSRSAFVDLSIETIRLPNSRHLLDSFHLPSRV